MRKRRESMRIHTLRSLLLGLVVIVFMVVLHSRFHLDQTDQIRPDPPLLNWKVRLALFLARLSLVMMYRATPSLYVTNSAFFGLALSHSAEENGFEHGQQPSGSQGCAAGWEDRPLPQV